MFRYEQPNKWVLSSRHHYFVKLHYLEVPGYKKWADHGKKPAGWPDFVRAWPIYRSLAYGCQAVFRNGMGTHNSLGLIPNSSRKHLLK